MAQTDASGEQRAAGRVADLYERHPYPPAADDLAAYRRTWDDHRRRAESYLFWPSEPFRDTRSILVAGCGTTQAAHYAVRWPNARVTGIDISDTSIGHTQTLQRKHRLENLAVRKLAVEQVAELGQVFDQVVCTGVLHHLVDPGKGLRALREVLAPTGALHLMVYAPYGRAGVYMLQEYCRRLGIGWAAQELRDLAATLGALSPDHPLAALLRTSPDFTTEAGLADALLHPQDRPYSVPQLLELLDSAELHFGRWVRQAPYSAHCGAIATTPHAAKLAGLAPQVQAAAMELFRGTMARHSLVAYKTAASAEANAVTFEGDAWREYVPVRLPGTIVVKERLPAGAAAVLINRNHSFTDLYLPIDQHQEAVLEAIDGKKTAAEIGDPHLTRNGEFFEQLWRWDQLVFDASGAARREGVGQGE